MFTITNDYLENLPLIEKLDKFLIKVVTYLKINNCIFDIIIINDEKIHEINKNYRHIDHSTDVISFAFEDNQEFEVTERLLGDIYISYDAVIRQSKEYDHSEYRELCFLALHGLLHLLGYDHEEDAGEMFEIQNKILEEFDVRR